MANLSPHTKIYLDRVVVLSVQPIWSGKIMEGTKTIELRRQAPRFSYGQPFIIYSTMPEGRLTSFGRFGSILRMNPQDLWFSTADRSGVDKEHFDQYFGGKTLGAGIEIIMSEPLVEHPTLDELRERVQFRAPQTWLYMSVENTLAMFSTGPGRAQVQDLLGHPGQYDRGL